MPHVVSLFARASQFADRTAVVEGSENYTYKRLLEDSARVASALLGQKTDLEGDRVCFLAPPGYDYVAVQWGIWRAGGVAVPLATMHPRPELEYTVDDSGSTVVVVHPELRERVLELVQARGLTLLTTIDALAHATTMLPGTVPGRDAMIVYTSGTTSRPKGVVTTHANIEAQITALIQPWGWTEDDRILNVLPMHHVHGIINVLGCSLWAGACCEFLPFEAQAVWARLAKGDLTLFMAVPTIYSKLISAFRAASESDQKRFADGCRGLRLMISGSAALPVSTLEAWRGISGHTLLERYGMTEIGMALSNPLDGERVPGFVGTSLPSVEVRRVDANGVPMPDDEPCELQVRGPGVFRGYWNQPDATRECFVDGWFRTGDVTVVENGVYKILGRSSVDIIKTGGYKVSALEIEEVLRTHPAIRQCAVVGVEDDEWGERVGACLVVEGDLALEPLREWAGDRLASYKVPSLLLKLEYLPCNPMGKVQKPVIKRLFQEGAH